MQCIRPESLLLSVSWFMQLSSSSARHKKTAERSRSGNSCLRLEPMQCVLIYANIGLLTQEVRGRRSTEHLCNLSTSVKNLVRATRLDVLCMSEVGSYYCTKVGSLSKQEMAAIIEMCCDAWTDVMDCEVGWKYEWPHPYLTLYNKLTTEITKAEVVSTFVGGGQCQRFAQVLSCTTRGCEPFDIWNIHNPCPKRPHGFTDNQRETSLDRILSMKSLSNPEKKTTEAQVVLGGDMNITSEFMHFLLDKLSQKLGNLSATFVMYKPRHTAQNYSLIPENSPDFCLSSLQAEVLEFETDFPVGRKAHIPYGICIQCEPSNKHQMPANSRTRRWNKAEECENETSRRWQKGTKMQKTL